MAIHLDVELVLMAVYVATTTQSIFKNGLEPETLAQQTTLMTSAYSRIRKQRQCG